jgi:WD40 repeat protein/predicted Ser/Thr protein kinase
MDNWIGKQLGQYQITDQVGRGGMAVVYQAWQPALGRHVAIKLLSAQFAFDEEFVARFRREAKSAAQLKHAHIVTIYDVGEQEGTHYIVMEYLEGRSLHDLIETTGPMPLERVVHIASHVASALDYAHQCGFVHRDIKPANIIVGPNDHATLTDFGIAKAIAGTSLTQTGMMVGTPQYMAPEQVQGAAVDPRTDVYALGIVCYEMLVGAPPFVGDTAAVLYAQAHKPPPLLRTQLPALSPPVEAAVNRALAKHPADRFSQAGDLVVALRAEPTRLRARLSSSQAAEASSQAQDEALTAQTAVAPFPLTKPSSRVRTAPMAPRPAPSGRPAWILLGFGLVAIVVVLGLLLLLLARGGGKETGATSIVRATATATQAGATSTPTAASLPTTSPPPTSVSPSHTPAASATPTGPGELVAYAAGPDGAWQILVANPATGETWLLPGQLPNSGVPAWSPDGERLAFRSDDSGNWQVYTINVGGSDLRQLTHVGNNLEAAWSPDGTQIAFVSDRDGNREIYVMGSDGGNQRRLTVNPGWDDDPSWSPDGEWLVFESKREGRIDVYKMRVDGTSLTRLTDDGDSNSTPTWSPDGRWIAFERRSGSIYHIWVMDADGENQWQLTTDGELNLRSAWSPDGSEIAYTSDRGGVEAVWIIPLDRRGPPRRLSPGEGFDAAWSRR